MEGSTGVLVLALVLVLDGWLFREDHVCHGPLEGVKLKMVDRLRLKAARICKEGGR